MDSSDATCQMECSEYSVYVSDKRNATMDTTCNPNRIHLSMLNGPFPLYEMTVVMGYPTKITKPAMYTLYCGKHAAPTAMNVTGA